MNEFTTYLFTHTTGEDQLNYFNGEIYLRYNDSNDISLAYIEQGTYRVVDGQLYQIKGDIPPALMGCK